MVLNPSEVALGPVVACARVLVHEVARTEELAKRRRAHSADHAGLEEHRAWYVLATRGIVVKHVEAVELRGVVAAVLAPPMPCMCTILREEEVWRWGARGRERAGRSGAT